MLIILNMLRTEHINHMLIILNMLRTEILFSPQTSSILAMPPISQARNLKFLQDTSSHFLPLA